MSASSISNSFSSSFSSPFLFSSSSLPLLLCVHLPPYYYNPLSYFFIFFLLLVSYSFSSPTNFPHYQITFLVISPLLLLLLPHHRCSCSCWCHHRGTYRQSLTNRACPRVNRSPDVKDDLQTDSRDGRRQDARNRYGRQCSSRGTSGGAVTIHSGDNEAIRPLTMAR